MLTLPEFRKAIADKANVPPANVANILAAISVVATEQLSAGDEVTLPGLGKLKPKVVPAHKGRNPRTGESIQIAEKTQVRFTPFKALTEAV